MLTRDPSFDKIEFFFTDQTMVYELDESEESSENNEERNSLRLSNDIEIDEKTKSHLLENRNWSWSYMKVRMNQENIAKTKNF